MEVKASEIENGRLQFNEIKTDILKLKAKFINETKFKHNKEIGTGLMIIDTAPKENERMRKITLDEVNKFAKKKQCRFLDCS